MAQESQPQPAPGAVAEVAKLVCSGSAQELRDYIGGGGSLGWQNPKGQNLVFLAARRQRGTAQEKAEIAELLIAAGVEFDVPDTQLKQTALFYAASYRQESVLELLLARGANAKHTDMLGQTALFYAADKGDAGCVARLLEARADPGCRDGNNGEVAVFYAVRNGHAECVRLLLQAGGAEPARLEDRAGHTLLSFARHPDTSAAVHAHLSVNTWGQTKLFFAARDGDLHGIDMLLKWGAQVDLQDFHKQTALFYAARQGQLAAVKALLEARADPCMQDVNEQTALFYAAKKGHANCAVALLEVGGDALAQLADCNGQTALSVAADAGTRAKLLKYKRRPEARGGARGRRAAPARAAPRQAAPSVNPRAALDSPGGEGQTQLDEESAPRAKGGNPRGGRRGARGGQPAGGPSMITRSRKRREQAGAAPEDEEEEEAAAAAGCGGGAGATARRRFCIEIPDAKDPELQRLLKFLTPEYRAALNALGEVEELQGVATWRDNAPLTEGPLV